MHTYALSKCNLCVGGDFNCVSAAIDKASGNLDKSSRVLDKIKNDLKLVDVWRSLNPSQKQFSFIDPSNKGHDSRIDLWLVPKSNLQHVNSCTMVQAPTPDHKAVSLDIQFCDKKRSRGYWKLNNSVLNDDEYREGIVNLYTETTRQYGGQVSNTLLWEFLKVKIKQFSISYCVMKSKTTQNQIKELEKRLDLLGMN